MLLERHSGLGTNEDEESVIHFQDPQLLDKHRNVTGALFRR